jgi:hypothetical protein
MPAGAVGATLVGEMAVPIAERTEPAGTAIARELGARQALALAIVRADATYLFAAQRLAELDGFLAGVRRSLDAGGYLVPATTPATDRSRKGALDATYQGRCGRISGEPANRRHRRLAHTRQARQQRGLHASP